MRSPPEGVRETGFPRTPKSPRRFGGGSLRGFSRSNFSLLPPVFIFVLAPRPLAGLQACQGAFLFFGACHPARFCRQKRNPGGTPLLWGSAAPRRAGLSGGQKGLSGHSQPQPPSPPEPASSHLLAIVSYSPAVNRLSDGSCWRLWQRTAGRHEAGFGGCLGAARGQSPAKTQPKLRQSPAKAQAKSSQGASRNLRPA
jgi:hypothetical protein